MYPRARLAGSKQKDNGFTFSNDAIQIFVTLQMLLFNSEDQLQKRLKIIFSGYLYYTYLFLLMTTDALLLDEKKSFFFHVLSDS